MMRFDTDKFEEVVKQSHKKNRKKNIVLVGLSVVLAIILVLASLFGIYLMNDRHAFENRKYIEVQARFMTPNVETSHFALSNIGLFNGKNVVAVQKDVAGYPVTWGNIIGTYHIFDQSGKVNTLGLGETSYPEGHRMRFFNPNTSYQYTMAVSQDRARKEDKETKHKQQLAPLYEPIKYPNNLEAVVKTENRVVEVGISFDKPYTYEAVQKMIPQNLVEAWYWVSEGEQASKKVEKLSLIDAADVFVPTVTFGFSNSGDFKFGGLELGRFWEGDNGLKQVFEKLKTDYSHQMDATEKTVLDGILKHNHLENKKDMRLNGIVLTGRSENFKQLIGQPWIKAASAGASAEIVPYIQPTK